MNTSVVFKDGKQLIIHHEKELTLDELKQLQKFTSEEFKYLLLSSGRFKKIPINQNPFLKIIR